MMTNRFEETIRELTKPLNDQLPRPWMTRMEHPLEADVFIVGMNQRNGYPASHVSQRRHLDALFNRNGESCRGLYDEITGGRPSRTRQNIDGLVTRLDQGDIRNVLETNVVCYSSPMSKNLRDRAHIGGAARGEEIFRYLMAEIAPAVLIVHGAGPLKRVSRLLMVNGLRVPGSPDEVCDVQTERYLLIPIPSLAPPGFNRWSSWAGGYLDEVVDRVMRKLSAQK